MTDNSQQGPQGPGQPPPGYAPAPPYGNRPPGQGYAAPQQPNPYAPQQFQQPYVAAGVLMVLAGAGGLVKRQ